LGDGDEDMSDILEVLRRLDVAASKPLLTDPIPQRKLTSMLAGDRTGRDL
jgi:hypothetical protein